MDFSYNVKGNSINNWFNLRIFNSLEPFISLRWRHNGCDSVSNHQPHDCLLDRLFRCRSNNTSKLRVTGLCVGNSPGIGEFPAQMAINTENVSIWWRHHVWSRSPVWWIYIHHDDVIKWKYFGVTGPLCGEFIRCRWIPRTKASDEGLWSFL